jgi:hypothetical protein
MHSFKDSTARAWNVEINVAQIKAVRSAVGVDCYKLLEDKLQPLGELLGDPCAFVDVLWVLCREQAQAAGISDDAFGRCLGGDAIEAAGDAFVEELIDFFPRGRREALRKLIGKGKQVGNMAMARATAELDQLTPEKLGQILDRHLPGPPSAGPTSSSSPGTAPELSASTPGPGPFVSS